jgi:hypothetical protein
MMQCHWCTAAIVYRREGACGKENDTLYKHGRGQ